MVFIIVFPVCATARTVIYPVPQLTFIQEFRDNYFQDSEQRKDQFITTYQLGISAAFLEKTHQVYLQYLPSYQDYDSLDEKDEVFHALMLDSLFRPSKYTAMTLDFEYNALNSDQTGTGLRQSADFRLDHMLNRHANVFLSQSFLKQEDQQVRTGEFRRHTLLDSTLGMDYEFGRSERISLEYSHVTDTYDLADDDDYRQHRVTVTGEVGTAGFTGMDFGLSYDVLSYDVRPGISPETLAGHVRILHHLGRHAGIFAKYAHTHTQKDFGTQDVFHPSVGVQWQVSEDSGITIGAGLLISRWDHSAAYDTERLFWDLDIYKDIEFSRRGTLSLSAASGYSQASPDAVSLGFNRWYQGSVSLTGQLTRRLSGSVTGTYAMSMFEEPGIDRTDETLTLGAGLGWTIRKWCFMSLDYQFTDFATDAVTRSGFYENRVTLSFNINFNPPLPLESLP